MKAGEPPARLTRPGRAPARTGNRPREAVVPYLRPQVAPGPAQRAANGYFGQNS
jgi:hypothetical protein